MIVVDTGSCLSILWSSRFCRSCWRQTQWSPPGCRRPCHIQYLLETNLVRLLIFISQDNVSFLCPKNIIFLKNSTLSLDSNMNQFTQMSTHLEVSIKLQKDTEISPVQMSLSLQFIILTGNILLYFFCESPCYAVDPVLGQILLHPLTRWLTTRRCNVSALKSKLVAPEKHGRLCGLPQRGSDFNLSIHISLYILMCITFSWLHYPTILKSIQVQLTCESND